MALQKPIVRHFIACDEILIAFSGKKLTLHNIIHTLRLRPGAGFPHTIPQIWLYAQLTDGRGSWPFGVDVRFHNDDSLLFSSPRRILDLGQDPLIVHGIPIPLTDVTFPVPGQYLFRLTCDRESIAEEKFSV